MEEKLQDNLEVQTEKKSGRTKIIIIAVLILLTAAAALFFLLRKDLSGKIVIPYIGHQPPMVDPHLPSFVSLADKLDEVMFDGLFNIAATPSGVIYEDGLGEYLRIDENSVVSVRLKTGKIWRGSFDIRIDDKDKLIVQRIQEKYFSAEDLRFTLRRIRSLGSLSPDYILVGQAIPDFDFIGPDENNVIKFKFKKDRIWVENDIKEILSFKILPSNSSLNALSYSDGTGPYFNIKMINKADDYIKNPTGDAFIESIKLLPFVDNSSFFSELRNNKINVLLETPFGSLSPFLNDTNKFFVKSNLSSVFFAVLFNVQRLNLDQRTELKKLLNNRKIIEAFYRIGDKQQREIVDFKGNRNNYYDYLNYSVFPTTSYYIEDSVVIPNKNIQEPSLVVFRDTIKIAVNLNYGFREELSELFEIINNPLISKGIVKTFVADERQILNGEYDAILLPFVGYRSNFLFDLYDIFLRNPDLTAYRINLRLTENAKGQKILDYNGITSNTNFFRINLRDQYENLSRFREFYDYVFGFMETTNIGDKQYYAMKVDELESELKLGAWLFSLPSLAYFSTQFEKNTVLLYGIASQLSTIEKWKEKQK